MAENELFGGLVEGLHPTTPCARLALRSPRTGYVAPSSADESDAVIRRFSTTRGPQRRPSRTLLWPHPPRRDATGIAPVDDRERGSNDAANTAKSRRMILLACATKSSIGVVCEFHEGTDCSTR